MRILIVGIGALGGTIAAHGISAGLPLWLATRSPESARVLRLVGLRVSGVSGAVSVSTDRIASVSEYGTDEKFDLILVATKAHDALEIAPTLCPLLTPDGAVLPIQNGGVAQLLVERLGGAVVVGGLSNLGATMISPGVYEQRNAGYLLIGEVAGGVSGRVLRIVEALKGGVEVKAKPNFIGAVWAKLLLNCSVTTIGAVAGQPMRQYVTTRAGMEVFRGAYEEALRVALASGIRPERMIVDPLPPGWDGTNGGTGKAYQAWLEAILDTYGDLKPSMLQDFERGRRTEIDFINGYVAELGTRIGMPTSWNTAITKTVHMIEHGKLRPGLRRLEDLARDRQMITECSRD